MALQESDKVKIRKYMGLQSLYLQQYKRFEDAMVLIQARSEGGNMIDNSAELSLKNQITEIEDIEEKLKDLRIQAQVKKAGADDIELNPAKGAFLLRSEGRRFISVIAQMLGVTPRVDYFSGAVTAPFLEYTNYWDE